MTARIKISWAIVEPELPSVPIVIDATPAITLTTTFHEIPISHVRATVTAAGGRPNVKAAN